MPPTPHQRHHLDPHHWHHKRMAGTALTLAEAATILNPPITERDLRAIVRALHWQPTGHRSNGRPGHPWPLYDAEQIMKLHGALSPWLGDGT